MLVQTVVYAYAALWQEKRERTEVDSGTEIPQA